MFSVQLGGYAIVSKAETNDTDRQTDFARPKCVDEHATWTGTAISHTFTLVKIRFVYGVPRLIKAKSGLWKVQGCQKGSAKPGAD